MNYYRLEGHTAVPCDLMEWVEQLASKANRRVALDRMGGVTVSTVFLGWDHQYGNGPPLIFETMIFGGPDDNTYQERYSTWDEALVGHQRAVELSRPWRRPWRYAVTLPNRFFWLKIAIQKFALAAYCRLQRSLRGFLRRLRRQRNRLRRRFH